MSLFGLLRLPASIIFGSGQRAALAPTTARLGSRALVCTDARLGHEPVFHALLADLAKAGVAAKTFDRTQPDVPLASLEDCLTEAAGFTPEVVIGIGGGSCMDLAKTVALLMTHGGRPEDYYGENKVPGPVIPVIALPTTAGTGSEVTPVAVLSDPGRQSKVGISSPYLTPKVAICDPELTVSCPPVITAVSGADALTHAVESFTAAARAPTARISIDNVFVGKNVLSDQFALLAITSIWSSLQRAYREGTDLEARERMMLAALAAGCAFATAGTAAAHALQYPVGNDTHTAHGAGVALLLPYVMEYNRPECAGAYATIARAVGLETRSKTDEQLSFEVIDAVAALLASVGIPRTLQELGLAEDRQDWTAESAIAITRLVNNNPRKIDVAAMRRITRAAFYGDRLSLRN
jgi:alcohol dehydrogenase